MALTRISITIPRSLVAALDRKAKELDRSRSWVIAEAARRFVESAAPAALAPATAVHEAEPPAYAASEVAAARQRRLEAELALSPGERLRRAFDLGRLARARHGRGVRHQVIGFDSYEDYYQWKKARLAGA